MSKQWKVEPQCGRPLGQRFAKKTGDSYIVDIYYGLLIVGPEGGIATPLATHVEGKPTLTSITMDPSSSQILAKDTIELELSKDRSFLLLTETTNCSLMKYWLKGPKRGPVKLIANLPGFPDNVRLNEKGEFWVVIDCCRTPAQEVLTHNQWIKSVYFKPPIWMWHLTRFLGMRMYTVVSLFSE
ncbi:protein STRICTOSIDINE SYNTHASE-LIKE 13-like isoform X2 [Actinidia eriantha]|nr:protein STRICTOSIDINE SYNTHASE-LIKE 13-like isoform X2 [Actinidia eriantha]XP_057472231.1 protein STRICTOSIDINE SYNTHASE-LIKE 13-like isoform X2 [Actinidia eriantha]